MAAAIAVVARGAASFLLPAWLPEVLVAVALGVTVRSLLGDALVLVPGLRLGTKTLLRLGIVLLGAQLSLAAIVRIGALAVGLIVLLMAVAFVVAIYGGRMLGVGQRVSLLIAVGTAVCGNTAIISTAPIIQAEDREVSYAVGVTTLFGSLALFLYPLIGLWLAIDQPTFGMWAGSAINDTSQVVAAGSAFGATALTVATVVKLTRNALMLPVLLAISLVWRRSGARQDASGVRQSVLHATPLFVIGFLLLASARSVGLIGEDVAAVLYGAARGLVLVALAAVGLSTSVHDLAAPGLRPLGLGLSVAGCIALLSLAVLLVTELAPMSL